MLVEYKYNTRAGHGGVTDARRLDQVESKPSNLLAAARSQELGAIASRVKLSADHPLRLVGSDRLCQLYRGFA